MGKKAVLSIVVASSKLEPPHQRAVRGMMTLEPADSRRPSGRVAAAGLVLRDTFRVWEAMELGEHHLVAGDITHHFRRAPLRAWAARRQEQWSKFFLSKK